MSAIDPMGQPMDQPQPPTFLMDGIYSNYMCRNDVTTLKIWIVPILKGIDMICV